MIDERWEMRDELEEEKEEEEEEEEEEVDLVRQTARLPLRTLFCELRPDTSRAGLLLG